MKKEIWKDVKGYQGLYKVSNLGNVKSLDRYTKHYTGVPKKLKGKLLSQTLDKSNGYYCCTLTKNGRNKKYKHHHLVAVAFLGDFSKTREVNHKDGNKTNNNIENLEWVTASYNTLHAYQNKLNSNCNQQHKNSKLKNDEVLYIKNSLLANYTDTEISVKYNVTRKTINNIRNNKTWNHL